MNTCHFAIPACLFLCISGPSSVFAQGKKYAVCVGVNRYEHPKLTALRFAVNDAHEMAAMLRQHQYQVVEITDETAKKPNKATIETEVTQVIRNCQSGDVVILCFAGHGQEFEGEKSVYFCPLDAVPFRDETSTLVSLTGIYQQLDKSFAGVKVMFVDACRDDPDAARGSRGGATGGSTPPPRGVAALFSCSKGQRAFEHESIKHGVFFHYVLEGLKGSAANSDKEISFADLSGYVQRRVTRNVKRIVGGDAQQAPNVIVDLEGESPVLAFVTAVPDRDTNQPAMKKSSEPSSQPAAETGLTRSVKSESCGMEFVLIPAGEFLMGSPADDKDAGTDEKPLHKVRITRPYYIGKYEVTQREWKLVMDTSPWLHEESVQIGDRIPASYISKADAYKFATILSKRDGRKYSLPTEAQWEYACRSKSNTKWYFGDRVDDLGDHAWCSKNTWNVGAKFPHPVGQKTPNAFGVFDMLGNVEEWCADYYDERYYTNSPFQDPEKEVLTTHIVKRGGGYLASAKYLRCASRSATPLESGFKGSDTGLRLVMQVRD